MVIPIPSSTSKVSGFCVVELREDTFSFNQVVSFETRSTSSIIIVSFTKIRDSNTLLFRVKSKLFRTFQTNLIIPVPSSTSKVGRLSVVRLRENTFSISKIITLVAFRASTILVPSFTLVRNGNTFFISVENPSVGAFQTNLVGPIPSSTT